MPDEGVSGQSYQDFSLRLHDKVLSQKRYVNAQVELTYACNLHCVHCYTDPLNRPELLKKEMPFEKVIALLDKLYAEEAFWICFTGGEVFMRKDFFRIYDYAHGKGFLITLFTNGTLVSETVADHLREKPPFHIEVSFHGATDATFDAITQVPGSFRQCVQGVKRLLDRGLPVKLKTKAMTLNRQELGLIKAFVENLGLPFNVNAVIYPRLDGDDSSCSYRLDPKEIVALESGLEDDERDANCGGDLQDESSSCSDPAPSRMYRCGCGKLGLHVDPYGGVGACTWQREKRFDFSRGLLEDGMRTLADVIDAAQYPSDSQCRDCKAHLFCDKKPEFAVYEKAGPSQPVEHFCDLAFERLRRINNNHRHLE